MPVPRLPLKLCLALALCLGWFQPCAGQEGPLDPLITPWTQWGVLTAQPEAWSLDEGTPYVQRFGAGHRFGDGLGFTDGYTDLEWMLPIKADDPSDILFTETHLLIHNDGNVGLNVNLGYRWYDTGWNRIFGMYAFWDYTQTDVNNFRQLGFGFESLGPILDFRGNVYLPNIYNVRGALPNEFLGHNLIINRAQVAMTGGDIEMGINLPEILNTRSRVYGGGYFYDGHGTGNTSGWRVRAEAELNRNAWVDASWQEDKLFGETVNLAVTWRYGHRFRYSYPAPQTMDHKFFRAAGINYSGDISDRLSDPIARTQNIVLTRDDGIIATTPGGVPLNFLHVANGGVGPGTIESPYGSITAALADPAAATSIIYTPFGGTFTENVLLIDNATVLGNGPIQTVNTQLGSQLLPFSGQSVNLANLPEIIGNVVVANNSRFSGFAVTGGMAAPLVNGFTVENSRIHNPLADALVVGGVTTGTFQNLRLSSDVGRGLLVVDARPTLNNITVTSAATDGVGIYSAATPQLMTINNLTVEAAGGNGLDVRVLGAQTMNLTLAGTTRLTATGNAFNGELQAGSTGNLQLAINNLTASSTAGTGINLNGTAGTGTLTVTGFQNNTVERAATGGLNAERVTFDSNVITAGIQAVNGGNFRVGSSTNPALVQGDGVRLIDPTGTLNFTALNISNDNGTGLLVDTKGGGTTFTLTGSSGNIYTTNGPALNLDPLTVTLTLNTVRSDNSPTEAFIIDTVTGAININSTTLNNSVGTPIVISNTPAPLLVNFGNTVIRSTISDQQADNIDTSVSNGPNLLLNFTSLRIFGP